MQMFEIEALTQQYAEAREDLRQVVNELEQQLQRVREAHLPTIKSRVAEAIGVRDALTAAVEGNPELFTKPRTVTLHGIRVGYMKGRGQISFDDPARVVALIKRHLPAEAEQLIKLTETPVKTALNNLSTADLRRIGCTLVEAGDEVLIKPVDTQVDKLVNALLADDQKVAA